jgi:hypothetical protein
MGAGFVDDCVENTSSADIDCALAAKTQDQLRACSSRR